MKEWIWISGNFGSSSDNRNRWFALVPAKRVMPHSALKLYLVRRGDDWSVTEYQSGMGMAVAKTATLAIAAARKCLREHGVRGVRRERNRLCREFAGGRRANPAPKSRRPFYAPWVKRGERP